MKRYLTISLAILLIVLLLIGGCSSPAPIAPAPAPPKTTSAAPAPKPAPVAQPITLKLGSDAPPVVFYNQAADWWCKEVAKQTQGRIVIEQYHANSLVTPTEAIASLNGGLIDLYQIAITQLPAQFPISQVFCLPGFAFPSTIEGKIASCTSYESFIKKYPALTNEWKGLQIMYANPGPTFYIISKSKEIRVPADIAGLKVGGLGIRVDLIKALGAAAVAAPPPQSYQMLQSGVVEAFTSPWPAVYDYQLWEVVSSQVDVDTGVSAIFNVMSAASWNKISPDDQKILLNLASQATAKSAEVVLRDEQAAIKKFTDYGRKIFTLTPEQRAAWLDKYKTFWDDWIAKQESKGVTGVRELFNSRKAEVDAAWAKK